MRLSNDVRRASTHTHARARAITIAHAVDKSPLLGVGPTEHSVHAIRRRSAAAKAGARAPTAAQGPTPPDHVQRLLAGPRLCDHKDLLVADLPVDEVVHARKHSRSILSLIIGLSISIQASQVSSTKWSTPASSVVGLATKRGGDVWTSSTLFPDPWRRSAGSMCGHGTSPL